MTVEDVTPSHRLPTPEEIGDVVCAVCGVHGIQMRGSNRHRATVIARGLFVHLCRELTAMSYPQIARALGRAHHSTVITSHQRLRERLAAGERVTHGLDHMTIGELLDAARRRVQAQLSEEA